MVGRQAEPVDRRQLEHDRHRSTGGQISSTIPYTSGHYQLLRQSTPEPYQNCHRMICIAHRFSHHHALRFPLSILGSREIWNARSTHDFSSKSSMDQGSTQRADFLSANFQHPFMDSQINQLTLAYLSLSLLFLLQFLSPLQKSGRNLLRGCLCTRLGSCFCGRLQGLLYRRLGRYFCGRLQGLLYRRLGSCFCSRLRSLLYSRIESYSDRRRRLLYSKLGSCFCGRLRGFPRSRIRAEPRFYSMCRISISYLIMVRYLPSQPTYSWILRAPSPRPRHPQPSFASSSKREGSPSRSPLLELASG